MNIWIDGSCDWLVDQGSHLFDDKEVKQSRLINKDAVGVCYVLNIFSSF